MTGKYQHNSSNARKKLLEDFGERDEIVDLLTLTNAYNFVVVDVEICTFLRTKCYKLHCVELESVPDKECPFLHGITYLDCDPMKYDGYRKTDVILYLDHVKKALQVD